MTATPTSFLMWPGPVGAFERTELGAHPLTVGTSSLCGVALAGEGLAAVHVAIARGPQGATARRLTRVGTFSVDGAETEEHVLTSGARLALGDVEAVYLEERAVSPTELRVTLSREDGGGEATVTVSGTRVVIGRSEGDIVVDDTGISGRHVLIEHYGPGLLWVSDLGSTNGTELNGDLVDGRRALAPGDILKVGRLLVMVEEGGETAPNADLRPKAVSL